MRRALTKELGRRVKIRNVLRHGAPELVAKEHLAREIEEADEEEEEAPAAAEPAAEAEAESEAAPEEPAAETEAEAEE